MAKYHFTNKAVEDLSNIWNYTYEVWSEKQVEKQMSETLNIVAENILEYGKLS